MTHSSWLLIASRPLQALLIWSLTWLGVCRIWLKSQQMQGKIFTEHLELFYNTESEAYVLICLYALIIDSCLWNCNCESWNICWDHQYMVKLLFLLFSNFCFWPLESEKFWNRSLLECFPPPHQTYSYLNTSVWYLTYIASHKLSQCPHPTVSAKAFGEWTVKPSFLPVNLSQCWS